MKFSNSQVERITKDVSTITTLDDGKEFTLCGEIVNGEIDIDSVNIVFHEISWLPRYSFDDKSDKQGRWARIAMFRSIKIAWINRFERPDGEVKYHLSTFFPVSSNDLPFQSSVHETFIDAKRNAENLWVTFINHCR
jgi:hypothetical protein